MGKTPKTMCANFGRSVTMMALALVLCLVSIAPASAQRKPIAFESNTELSPASKSYYEGVAGEYADNIKNGNIDKAATNRNRLIYLAVDQIDLNFYDFQRNTRKKRALWQTVLDILEIGASTAIAITNGERAKTLIAEGLGFVQASRTSINKNYALKDTQILFNKMVSKRADILATMLTKSVQDVEQYPFEASLIDLIAYFKAGTFDGALENLNIDTGAEASEATKNVERIKIVTKAQLEASIVYRATLADLLIKLKTSPDAAVKSAARAKLIAGLKAVPELLDGLTLSAIDQLADNDFEKVYRAVGQKLIVDSNRAKIQKVIDALK